MSVSKTFPRTEISSGSTKPDKAPAELATDSAELARDSSELLMKGEKKGWRKRQRTEGEGEKRDRQGEKREEDVHVVNVHSETKFRLLKGPVTKVKKTPKIESFCKKKI